MQTVSQQTPVPDILRRAADALDGLPHARVHSADVHLALIKAAPSYGYAQEALNALHVYMRTAGEDRWLPIGTVAARPRADVAAQLRAAAEHDETREAVAV